MFNTGSFFFLAVVNLFMVELFALVCLFFPVNLAILEYAVVSLKEY